MACTGAYGVAWQYAAFWCPGTLISGTHEGVGPADASLSCSWGDFRTRGILAGVGMVLYNLTANTSGVVTAVTDTTLTATGVTWAAGATFRIVPIKGVEISTINHWLGIAAGDIHAALAAVGACDCVLADWATNFLTKLNIIDVAAYYHCQCAREAMSGDTKLKYLDWMSQQLASIADGTLELCQGHTGKNYPAAGWATPGITEWQQAEIIWNDILRNS